MVVRIVVGTLLLLLVSSPVSAQGQRWGYSVALGAGVARAVDDSASSGTGNPVSVVDGDIEPSPYLVGHGRFFAGRYFELEPTRAFSITHAFGYRLHLTAGGEYLTHRHGLAYLLVLSPVEFGISVGGALHEPMAPDARQMAGVALGADLGVQVGEDLVVLFPASIDVLVGAGLPDTTVFSAGLALGFNG